MTNQIDTWPAGATATMNVTYTQANAAGGAVVCEISPVGGSEFIVLAIAFVNSGTNGSVAATETATGGVEIARHISIASGAATFFRAGVGLVATTQTTNTPTGIGYPLIISGTQALKIFQTAAGVQNDTFQVLVNIRCKGSMPTVIHSNSTNAANVTVTAGAESFTTV